MDNLFGLNTRMTTELSPLGVGLPFLLFADPFEPQVDVHDALSMGMNKWENKFKELLRVIVVGHVENTHSVSEVMKNYDLTTDETCAIVYYSVDVRNFGGSVDNNPYRSLNMTLSSRNINDLELWKPFLYFLIKGLNKLPNVSCRVFRALDKPITSLSKQYTKGKNIVWVAFTSTTQQQNVMLTFSTLQQGTWMMLDVIEGKDISQISLFPNESEILLLPNSSFIVEDILSKEMKLLTGIPSEIDVLVMKQIPTAPHLMIIQQPLQKNKLTKDQSANSASLLEPSKQPQVDDLKIKSLQKGHPGRDKWSANDIFLYFSTKVPIEVAQKLQDQLIDGESVMHITKEDLDEMGLKLGPRKIILSTIATWKVFDDKSGFDIQEEKK